jgi:glycosyltransferase involved in cell wall biosynthesis
LKFPLISIIIPVYNSKDRLPAALDSILSQDYTDYEIVIIDGLSTDGTIDLIKDYQSKTDKIRYKSEADKGIYDAMNKGMDMATGQWVYFLGSDDRLYSNSTLSVVAGHLSSTTNSVVYGNAEIVGNTAWSKNAEIYDGPFSFEKLLNKNICHQSIFYRAEFVKKEIGRYNINYRLCADWDLNLRCYAKTDFLFIDSIVAKFYGGGITSESDNDKNFSKEFMGNVIEYFKLSLYDPVINTPDFNRYHEVWTMQKKENFARYILNRLKMKFI